MLKTQFVILALALSALAAGNATASTDREQLLQEIMRDFAVDHGEAEKIFKTIDEISRSTLDLYELDFADGAGEAAIVFTSKAKCDAAGQGFNTTAEKSGGHARDFKCRTLLVSRSDVAASLRESAGH